MFKSFFNFEIKSSLRSPMVYIFIIVLALLPCLATCMDDVQIGGSIGNVLRNAPYVVQQFYAIMSIFGLFMATAFINAAALRDFENNTNQIIFASPISKMGYYFGHFFGAYLIALIPILGISLGIVAGTAINSVTESIDLSRFGPHNWLSHFNSFMVFTVPNIFFCGAIVYAIATMTRNTMYSYLAVLILLVGYIASGILTKDIRNESIAIFTDPLGIRAFSVLTKYWTVDEKNTISLGLSGMMFFSRLLWVAVGLGILFLGYFKFSFNEKNKSSKKERSDSNQTKNAVLGNQTVPIITPAFNQGTVLSQLWNQVKVEVKGMLRSTPFFLLTIIGMANMLPSLIDLPSFYGNTVHPVTYQMCDSIRGAFYLFIICVLTFFSGELVWKERQAKVNDIYDAMPTKTWTTYVSKLSALVAVVAAMMILAITASIISQTLHGYYNYEIGVYIKNTLVLDLLGFIYLAVASMFIHSVVNNKYVGFFAFIVFIIINSFLWSAIDVSSYMVKFGQTPSVVYSDMNGFGPYTGEQVWFNIYWIAFSALVAMATILLWMRGRDSEWKMRWFNFKLNFAKSKYVTIGLLAIWILTASFVFYNTKILNKYTSGDKQEQGLVDYEKKYKKYEGIAQPRIVDVKYKIDLYPAERRLEVDGDYVIKNKSHETIDSLHVLFQVKNGRKIEYTIERSSNIYSDKDLGYQIFKIEPALAPGDSLRLKFHSTYSTVGFENGVSNTSVVQNGSFFNNTDIAPVIGYTTDGEMTDKNKRVKYGLPERRRAPKLTRECGDACHKAYISHDADWVNVETIFGTSSDQTAVAPGSLHKQWQEGGRNYFHYKLDHFAWNFYSFISATFEVMRDKYKDIDIEIYYQKGHEYNVDKMISSIKNSLDYYITNFGPYYHKQCRIIEFPRYAEFAQAFPGTMPYSEGIGFIADLEDPDDIDMVTYVVAHEMGHQWWAHQVCGAEMQGATLMSETFAQYSALMVMEKQYGRDKIRKFLKYEMDKYLRDRGGEREKELPLMQAENQGYIHYRKGSVVMYYLKEMIGENTVNLSLKTFLDRFKYKTAPYPTSHDVVDEFKRNTPDSLQYLIKDMFEDITLFSNRTKEAKVKKLDNGKFEVTIVTESQKFKADELGKETETSISDWVEIGALAKPEKRNRVGKLLFRKTVKINKKDNTYTFILDEKPDKAGIDPNFYLVDRQPNDNLKNVEE